MNVSYEGIGYLAVTFPAGSCVAGQVCKLNTQGHADKCSDGEAFCGFTEAVDGQRAAVQLQGFLEVGYTGTAPACGFAKLSSNGNGGVKADSAGREYLVAQVNTTTSKVIIKL